MTDETNTPEDENELGADASRADLKAAADDLLKANPAPKEVEEEFGEELEEAAEEAAPLTDADHILALEVQIAEAKDQMLRMLAEGQNIRKRAEKQVADARVYAVEKFAGDVLSVSDNLARALEAVSEEARAKLSENGTALLEGIEITRKDLSAVLGRNGVTEIEAEPGMVFDPNLHQAVSKIPSAHDEGTIAALFQPGWRIGTRTLRAAMVAVSEGGE